MYILSLNIKNIMKAYFHFCLASFVLFLWYTHFPSASVVNPITCCSYMYFTWSVIFHRNEKMRKQRKKKPFISPANLVPLVPLISLYRSQFASVLFSLAPETSFVITSPGGLQEKNCLSFYLKKGFSFIVVGHFTSNGILGWDSSPLQTLKVLFDGLVLALFLTGDLSVLLNMCCPVYIMPIFHLL